MEFNSSPGELMELSPLFSDDSRVAEAASVAQKLRKWIYLYDITILCFLWKISDLKVCFYMCMCVCLHVDAVCFFILLISVQFFESCYHSKKVKKGAVF